MVHRRTLKRKKTSWYKEMFYSLFSRAKNKNSSLKREARRKRSFQRNLWKIQKWSAQNTKILFLWGIIIALNVFIWLVFFSWYFKISELYISRQDSVTNIEKAYSSMRYIRWKNIFLIDNASIVERLQKSQSSIKNIALDIDFPSTLNIIIESFSPIFQTEQYYILENGSSIEKQGKNTFDVPSINIIPQISSNEDIFKVRDLDFIRDINESLRKNILGIGIQNILYYVKENELLIISQNWNIYMFDTSEQVASQVERLAIYDQEKWSLDDKLVYIDVRIPGKLYVCWNQFEFDCRKNLREIYGENILTLKDQVLSESQQ